MPIKTNQLIAVEKGVKARAVATMTQLHHLNKKAELFQGLARTYQPKDEDGDKLPAERKVVQHRALDHVATLRTAMSELIDLTVQKDLANQKAKASVCMDGAEVPGMTDLPVTSLLSLEKIMLNLRTYIEELPVLDNAEDWKWDEKAALYRTDPVDTHRTKKVMKVLTLVQPTDKHPGQAQPYQEDVIAGYWSQVKHSAAIPYNVKKQWLEQADKILIGIKQAREVANDAFVTERTGVGTGLFDRLFATG